MNNAENDMDDQAIRALMEKHGLSEAEVRISLAINAHSAKNTNDVRVVGRGGEPKQTKKKRVGTGRAAIHAQ